MQAATPTPHPYDGQTIYVDPPQGTSLCSTARPNQILQRTSQKRRLESTETLQQQCQDDEKSLRVLRNSIQAPTIDITNEECSCSREQQSPPLQATLSLPSFISFLTSPIVTLKVGGPDSPEHEPRPTSFFIHKHIITKYSTFFSAAFGHDDEETTNAQGWKEKQSLEMHLPEDRAEDVGWLIKWLYSWDALVNKDTLSVQDKDQNTLLYASRPVLGHESIYTLWHSSIDNALDEHRVFQERKHSCRSKTCPHPYPHSHIRHDNHGNSIKRPNPPALGPLVRLYIIADKYGVTTDTQVLQRLICSRVRDIAKLACCVPSKENIGLLWKNVIRGPEFNVKKSAMSVGNGRETCAGPYGSKSSLSASTSISTSTSCLKEVILSLFTSLPQASRIGLFTTSSLPLQPEPQSQLQSQSQSNQPYHPEFLQDLLIRTLQEEFVKDEKIREENMAKEREREERRIRFERMRIGKVRILG